MFLDDNKINMARKLEKIQKEIREDAPGKVKIKKEI